MVRRRPVSPRAARSRHGDADPAAGGSLEAELNKLPQSGTALSREERQFFEPRFGNDFGNVRIHTDAQADRLARTINVEAFTFGSHIAFRSERYAPRSESGRRLLAHELTHVVQQTGANPTTARQVQRTIGDGHDLAAPRFSNEKWGQIYYSRLPNRWAQTRLKIDRSEKAIWRYTLRWNAMLTLEHKRPTLRGRSVALPTQRHHTLPQSASPAVQRASSCACGGSCPRCQAKSTLKIGAPGDAYEREADAVAARVMRMTAGAGPVTPAASGPQRKCADCENESEEPLLQAKAESSSPSAPTSAPASVDAILRSPGQALDSATRAFFEPRFGRDFSTVQVHADSAAEQSAQDVNAHAYTVGQHIVFAPGRFAPGTSEGRHLIAHELTHVVQQDQGSAVAAKLQLNAGNHEVLEEAAQHAEQLVDGTPPSAGRVTPAAISRSFVVQRSVRPGNVSCRTSGLTGPDLTGDEVVAAIEAADAGAIALAQQAEDQLTAQLSGARAGDPVDADFDSILQEELGLTLTNPAQFGLIQQQIGRFRRVRETLESGHLRYLCRGGTVKLVGCDPAGTCGPNFAFTCPGNRLVVLCQAFWDQPDERPGTLLHEPFHIWFHMARHATDALKRADASCFEAFARRLAGESPPFSCVDHTAG